MLITNRCMAVTALCSFVPQPGAPLDQDRALRSDSESDPPPLPTAPVVMPPRRSGDSSAKRAAEEFVDDTDAAKRDKRARLSRSSIVTAAAARVSPAAAAAAAASSSSGFPGPAAAAAAAAAAAGVDCSQSSVLTMPAATPDDGEPSHACTRCRTPYADEECKEEGNRGRLPRSLSCRKRHTFCTDCLEQMVQHDEDDAGNIRSFVPCPECGFEHVLRLVAVASAAAASEGGPTNADLVRRIAVNSSLVSRRSQRLHEGHGHSSAHLDRSSQPVRVARCPPTACRECGAAASLWCDECKVDLCVTHDSMLHARSLSSHVRIPTADKHACVEAQRAAVGAKLKRDTADALRIAQRGRQAEIDKAAELDQQLKDLKDQQAELEQRMREIEEKKQACATLNDRYERRVAGLQSAIELLARMSDAEAQSLEIDINAVLHARDDDVGMAAAGIPPAHAREPTAAAAAAARAAPVSPPVLAPMPRLVPAAPAALLPAAAAAPASPAAAPASSAPDRVRMPEARAQLRSAAAAAGPGAASAFIAAVRSRFAGGLLGALSDRRISDLAGFLDTADESLRRALTRASLLYRATDNGFQQEDFMHQCAGHRDTLTLVKDNGFIFGAFIRCAWPTTRCTVADPTGQSFAFSLVNVDNRAVRFFLRDRDHAIRVGHGIAFGADVYAAGPRSHKKKCLTARKAKSIIKIAPLFLMFKDRPANVYGGVAANDPLRHNTAYQPDDGIECDESTLGGQKLFAAAEIEVYQL